MLVWLKALFGGFNRRLEGEEELDIFNTTLNVVRTLVSIAVLFVLIFK